MAASIIESQFIAGKQLFETTVGEATAVGPNARLDEFKNIFFRNLY
jgi:hypothetical protein